SGQPGQPLPLRLHPFQPEKNFKSQKSKRISPSMRASAAALLLLCCCACGFVQASPAPPPLMPDDEECARTGRGCLGGVADIGVMRAEVRLMRLLFREMAAPVPAACGCSDESTRCVRRCYFAMLHSVNLDRGLQLLS
ncbi:hypothetical protein BOX15_Mlig023736g3, partial [Macrostomum lignano]